MTGHVEGVGSIQFWTQWPQIPMFQWFPDLYVAGKAFCCKSFPPPPSPPTVPRWCVDSHVHARKNKTHETSTSELMINSVCRRHMCTVPGRTSAAAPPSADWRRAWSWPPTPPLGRGSASGRGRGAAACRSGGSSPSWAGSKGSGCCKAKKWIVLEVVLKFSLNNTFLQGDSSGQ